MKRLSCIVVLMVIGTCLAEGITNVEDLLQTTENTSGVEDTGFSVSKYLENIQKRYGFEAYKKFVEVIQEIEVAKPTGELDAVFEKFCKKTPILKNCVAKFSSVIEPYLDQEGNKSNKIMLPVVDRVFDMICLKRGQYMTLFVADHGPECFYSKSSKIKQCLITMANQANILENLYLKFDQKDCSLLTQMKDCIMEHLITCSDSTAVNMFESLFNAVMEVLPC